MIVKITIVDILGAYCVPGARYDYFPQYMEKDTEVQRREMTEVKPPASKVRAEIFFFFFAQFFVVVKCA